MHRTVAMFGRNSLLYPVCLQQKQEQEKALYGYLMIKASYNTAAESLCVDILNARELLPLDPTGFSDPFVIIELVPRHYFPNCVKQRTKVQKKTLYPLFDETFEFRVSCDQCHREGAGLCFSVMDHDMVTKNDFEGEAFLPLCNVPGINGKEVKDLKPIELFLMHPNDKNLVQLNNPHFVNPSTNFSHGGFKGRQKCLPIEITYEILVALDARTWDKDAQDFVKNLKNRR